MDSKEEKAARLAAALRENLKRRKVQARETLGPPRPEDQRRQDDRDKVL